MKHLGDITKINGANVQPVNVVIGGSPCQDVSVAGRREGLKGERSGLFMEQIRIIKEMREKSAQIGSTDIKPRYMVWENVPGAFSSNKGQDFRAVLEETARIVEKNLPDLPIPSEGWHYSGLLMGEGWSVAWRVFDAQFWGVPQRRRRIALIADFGGYAAPEILFERKGVFGDSPPGGTPWKIFASTIAERFGKANRERTEQINTAYCLQCNGIDRADTAGCNGRGWREDKSYTLNTIDRPAVYDARGNGDGETVPTMTGDHENRVTDYTALCVRERCGCEGGGKGCLVQEEKNGTLAAKNDQFVCVLDRTAFNQGINAQYNPEISESGINSTLTAKGPGAVCESVVRRLTPLECERLQGFPDGWTILESIESMTVQEFVFWKDTLFQKGLREGKIRKSDKGIYEIWRFVKNKDGGSWKNTHKPYKHKTIGQMIKWYNKTFTRKTDGARYKALGNSIALPPWAWLLERLSFYCGDDCTMASLFDGIGGFPLIWETLNGEGSCLWASEIEEFPIAVTKYHFNHH